MSLVKELEQVLNLPTFMGDRSKTSINLAVNAILDKIEELGFDIVEKQTKNQ